MVNTKSSSARAWPWWGYVLLFVAVAAALLHTGWHEINQVNDELGDFAANSLLIQDAKSLTLTHGNYSRVGFNHPGPAILYVLAGGELLFHDWLPVLKSGFSGQLAAVALYNAAWIVLIFALMRKIAGSATAALLFVSVFLLLQVLNTPGTQVSIWFPHMYFFPFAAMLIAAARLVYGETEDLPALAVCCGFLVNGHVSFVATTAVVLLVVLAVNMALTRADRTNRICSAAFLRRHRGRIAVFFGIVFLFLVPLLIACATDDPAPVSLYLRFSKANKGNSLGQALHYVATYWGEGIAPLTGMVMAALAYFLGARATPELARASKSLLTVLLGASLALLYYAKVGVDMLDQKYIGFFYYAVPAFVAALGAMCCYQVARERSRRVAGPLLIAACLLAACLNLHAPEPAQTYLYNQPKLAGLYAKLRQTYPSGRLVLNLDNTEGWEQLWGDIAGLEAYAKRRHDDLFCINDNWHVLFTRAAKCTADEVAHATPLRVRSFPANEMAKGKPEVFQMGLAFYREPMLDVGGTALTLAGDGSQFARHVLGQGWSTPGKGEDMVWTVAGDAMLTLRAPAAYHGDVVLDLMAYLPTPASRQQVAVYVNDKLSANVAFDRADNRKPVHVPVTVAASPIVITLRIAAPVSPKQAGESNDTRPLGVALYGISS